ncbi:hypothetical protein H2198_000693 [Neophaeococcomyces mojaviensis]|uniref:Uncharacterized protein n=1 Tax=Neophaeococcomyces mojaviensis TaxID=3383035 RepID=A0ACC3AJ47_9EURO|nr:hypothetical protein H2198_000693 [Knufia sp. JES_112]
MELLDNQLHNSFDNIESIFWDPIPHELMINTYKEMLQNTENFYCSLNLSSSDPASPTSSISSSRESGQWLPKLVVKSGDAKPDKVERRRAQNKKSQRAYRDRKEQYQRDLEGKIAQWKEKHNKLTESYTAQSKEIMQLKYLIEELKLELLSLQSQSPDMWMQTSQWLPEFDYFSWSPPDL